jgi:hypothetical protein
MKRTFVLAAVLAVAAAVAVGAGIASAGSTRTAATTLHLVGKKLSSSHSPTVRQGALFVQAESISGDSTGRDGVTCTLVTKQGLALCQFVLALRDGQIVSAGLVPLDAKTFDIAVAGGTGKYGDAHGTIAVKNPSPSITDYTVTLD